MTEIVHHDPAVVVRMSEHAVFDPAVGLRISEDISAEELANVVRGFDLLQDSSCFAIGDVANFYREHFPEQWRNWIESMPKQAKERGTLDQKTVAIYARVCAFYPHDVRALYRTRDGGRRALSFAHFARLRRYGLDQAQQWLEHAAAHNLSLGQMEDALEAGLPGQDEVPPVPSNPETQYPSIIDLGHGHRLLCGDSTEPTHVQALFQLNTSETADMIWTDPPYGVEYVSKVGVALGGAALPSHDGSEAMTIQNDRQGDLGLLLDVWRATAPYVKPTTPFYVAGPTGDNIETFLQSFRQAGWRFEQMLIWRKHRMTPGRSDYHGHHESIFYGFTPGERSSRMHPRQGMQRWYGGDNQTTIFDAARPHASLDHPTMKPVKLIQPAIENSCPPGGIVFDPFAGSGSTLIAAHQSGRRAFLIEKDPAYADVIRRRFTNYLAEHAAYLAQQTAQQTAQRRADDIEQFGPTAFEGQ